MFENPDLAALLEGGLKEHQTGNLAAAAREYERVLARDPRNADALHLLGLIAHQSQDDARAVELIQQSLGINAHFPQAACNLGHAWRGLGNWAQAERAYRQALDQAPDFAEARFGLGIALHASGKTEAAVAAYQRAAESDPDNASLYNNLGNTLSALSRREEALSAYRRASELAPDFPEAQLNLGYTAQSLGHLDTALEAYRRAISLRPGYGEAHNNLGSVLQARGSYVSAIAAHERASELDPGYADAFYNLGHAYRQTNRPADAAVAYRRAAQINPGRGEYWEGLAASIAELPRITAGGALRQDLEGCLAREDLDAAPLGRAVSVLIREDPAFARLLETPPRWNAAETRDAVSSLSDPVLLAFLEKTHNVDLELETLLTELRRQMLAQALADTSCGLKSGYHELLYSLAHQCFLNEYVFEEREEETAQVAELQARLQTAPAIAEPQLALLASYRPLTAFPQLPLKVPLNDDEATSRLRALIGCQVEEPELEATIRSRLEVITDIEDSVSLTVRSQYEENPYPRWRGVTRQRPRPMTEVFTSLFPQLAGKIAAWPTAPRILDAGCGTAKHTIELAMRFPDAHLIGLDLSRASLAYAARAAESLGVANITFCQGDILKLERQDRFHMIVSTGVLHHLEDPEEGWQVLLKLLEHGGLMKIGLYSTMARRCVVAARSKIAEWRIAPTLTGIRQARTKLMRLPTHDPARQVVESIDFYTASRCRDLIFHVQERCFTLQEIAKIIEDLGLEFLGFELPRAAVLQAYRARFPQDAEATRLDLWHQYETENPHIFSAMYQLWLRKP